MADRLIRVNNKASVMASQVTAVIASEYGDNVVIHTLDGGSYELEFGLVSERWNAKRNFEQQVNDALAGE